MLVFILTMPGVGSWNGKWSGEGKLYCKTRSLEKKRELELDGKSFGYRWEDGWYASVKVQKTDSREATKMSKASNGFCGYEWMIDSIIKNNKIITD